MQTINILKSYRSVGILKLENEIDAINTCGRIVQW